MTKKLRVLKDFTYSSIIKEAILASKDQKATSSQIFVYIVNKHPTMFKESNSMTWKGNIRQLLSKNPEFVKLRKDPKTKLHFWKYVPMEVIEEKENELLFRYHPLYVDGVIGQPKHFNDDYQNFAPSYDYQGYYCDSARNFQPYTMNYNPLYIDNPYPYAEDYFYDSEAPCEFEKIKEVEFDYNEQDDDYVENKSNKYL